MYTDGFSIVSIYARVLTCSKPPEMTTGPVECDFQKNKRSAGDAQLDEAQDASNNLTKWQCLGNQSSKHTSDNLHCSLPPHGPVYFESYEAFEEHHANFHMHQCLDCRSSFGTSHLLALHITECHDPIKAAAKANGEPIVCSVSFSFRTPGLTRMLIVWLSRATLSPAIRD